MNILVTGGAGFIGSTLVDKLLLNKENKVIVIDNFDNYYDNKIKEENIKNNLNNQNYKLFRNDICNIKDLENIFKECEIDIVIHLAAQAGVRPSIDNPLKYVKNNIEGTTNILEMMKNFNIKKLIFGSSSSVYGNLDAEKFSEEIKVTKPISPYAATKLACEQMIYTYTYLYNIQAICLRFFTVYGPKQRPDLAINKFINLIEKDQAIPVYGDGSTIRDYTYIDDIVNGIIKAINYNDSSYEIINLGGNFPITLKEMITIIEKALNKKAIINNLPNQAGDVTRTASDITKAQRLLGYNPQTPFEEGINKYIEWRNRTN